MNPADFESLSAIDLGAHGWRGRCRDFVATDLPLHKRGLTFRGRPHRSESSAQSRRRRFGKLLRNCIRVMQEMPDAVQRIVFKIAMSAPLGYFESEADARHESGDS
jgi:hypothetical protein